MEWLKHLLLWACGRTAEIALVWLRDEIKQIVLDHSSLDPVFSLNRRAQSGFRWNRSQSDTNPERFRASDAPYLLPRFQLSDLVLR
jgi:hypothetical protein